MNQAAAIYTRVSSDRQKTRCDTIASQTAALVEFTPRLMGTPCTGMDLPRRRV